MPKVHVRPVAPPVFVPRDRGRVVALVRPLEFVQYAHHAPHFSFVWCAYTSRVSP